MRIRRFTDKEEVAAATARRCIEALRQRPGGLFCFAAGHTPVPALQQVAAAARQGQIDPARARWLGLDEWEGLDGTVPGSCRATLDEHFFGPGAVPPGQIWFPSGTAADMKEECRRLNRFLAESGPLDFLLLGVGVNGHLGFNEPGQAVVDGYTITDLKPETVRIGSKYFDDQPALARGITLGLGSVLAAREVVVMATGSTKQAPLTALLEGASPDRLPLACLNRHPRATVYTDSLPP